MSTNKQQARSSKSSVKKKVVKKKTTKKKAAQKGKKKVQVTQKPTSTLVDKTEVCSLYEKALTSLYNNDYRMAKNQLISLLELSPKEIEIMDRVRTFIKICDRHLKKYEEQTLITAEDAFNQGVLAHNQSHHEKAMSYFSRALELSTEEKDYIHYAMAASEAASGNTHQALEHLKTAIEINQKNRFFACGDPDFKSLTDSRAFREMVD